ncbi:MAG TPA: hypothetical protein VFC41_09505 [Anaerovoracaceae bacterium]|nr:hypothetical protein [Anaerovoracaceae bacterium]
MKNKLIAFALITVLILSTQGQIAYADINRNDMRAVWIATILNLDYPSVKNNEYAQKKEFITMLNKLQAVGINTGFIEGVRLWPYLDHYSIDSNCLEFV